VKLAMKACSPEKKEVVLGEAEVRQIFKIAKIGTIAGCFVRSGVIPRTGRVRIVRNGVEVYDGTLSSLKRFKDDVREVRRASSAASDRELQRRQSERPDRVIPHRGGRALPQHF